MNKEILFVTDKDSIAIKALMTGLIQRGFVPIPTAANYSSMPNAADCPPIVFLCMQDWHVDRKYLYTEVLRMVRDSGALLFLGGDRALTEEDGIIQTFKRENVEDIFLRPFNADQIAERLEEALDRKMEDPVFADSHRPKERIERKTILIVDDNPTSLRTLRNALHNHFKVYMSDSGINALSFLNEKKPDLILLDYEMPVLNGPQFLEIIRKRDNVKDIPVFFLTGKSNREVVVEVMAYKPAGYLLKSTPTEDIVKTLTDFFHAAHD